MTRIISSVLFIALASCGGGKKQPAAPETTTTSSTTTTTTSPTPAAACTQDADCKSDRVCESGTCVDKH